MAALLLLFSPFWQSKLISPLSNRRFNKGVNLAGTADQIGWEFTDIEASRKSLSKSWPVLQNRCLVQSLKIKRPGYCYYCTASPPGHGQLDRWASSPDKNYLQQWVALNEKTQLSSDAAYSWCTLKEKVTTSKTLKSHLHMRLHIHTAKRAALRRK